MQRYIRKSQHETRAFFRKVRRTGQQIGKSNMVAEDLKSFGKKKPACFDTRPERESTLASLTFKILSSSFGGK